MSEHGFEGAAAPAGADQADADQAGAEQTVVDADGNPISSKDDRLWAMFCHLGGMVLSLMGGLGLIAPLVIWLIKKDESEFVDDQGKEALNFHLTILIIVLACVLAIILSFGILALVVVPLLILLAFAELVVGIIASIQSYDGKRYRYPLNIRLVK